MLNFFKFIADLYNGTDGLGPPVIEPFDEGASSIGEPDWSSASVFSPPVFSPPVFSPPVFSPPVFSPPVFTTPTLPVSPPSPPPAVPPPVEPPSPSPFTIAITWDASVSSAPAGFGSDIIAAVLYLESIFTDPVTININVGYGEVAGQPLSSTDIGENVSYFRSVSYSTLRAAVAEHATTATDASVFASLPVNSPINGATYWVSNAQAKALGLIPADGTELDASVGFVTASNFTFGDNANGGAVAPDTYDFFTTVAHELTEVMGRELFVGETFAGIPDSYTLLDLLHYSSPGVRDLVQTTPGYFSVNDGGTDLGDFNTMVGDPGDWAKSVIDDSFDADGTLGASERVSANDLTEVDAIGWNPSVATGASMLAAPESVSVTPETQYLALAQGRFGLAGGGSLATVTQSDGVGSDQYSYALSGTDAASFNLVTEGNEEVVVAGPHGVQGGPQGKLYSLTMTATDETAAGNPSVTDPINVVVGDHGNDVFDLASLPGIVTSAPTFIYGLGGNVTIDGTGMTGSLYFDGGAGAALMTGGGGVNVYEYGGANDSTASAMDIITNFNVATDLIDLTGVSNSFSGVAALDPSATQIAPGSIGWQTSRGNTFVYANTSGQAERLTTANMEIELQGSVALTSANFTHL
jgi:hypothetical protein